MSSGFFVFSLLDGMQTSRACKAVHQLIAEQRHWMGETGTQRRLLTLIHHLSRFERGL
jgi:hypothetical protein